MGAISVSQKGAVFSSAHARVSNQIVDLKDTEMEVRREHPAPSSPFVFGEFP